MGEDKKYNGWTNYATWRINLEVFDDTYLLAEQYENIDSIYELSKSLEIYMEEILEQDIPECNKNSLILSYAMAFISEVNFYEIATHIWEEIQRNKKEETEETEETIEETIEDKGINNVN